MKNRGRKFSKEWRAKLSLAHIGLVDKEILRERGRLGAEKRWANHVKVVKPAKSSTSQSLKIKAKTHAEYVRLWRKANPLRNSISKKAYKARKKGAVGSHTWEEWNELIQFYGYICLCCKKTGEILTEDHIIPLSKGGSDYIENIQPLCRGCNSRKQTKTISYKPLDSQAFARS